MSKLKSALYPNLQKMKYAKLISLFKSESKKPVVKNKILMLSTTKGKLGGNLLAIKSYIESKGLNYKINAITSLNMPSLAELAGELATSEFVLVDDFEPMVYVLSFRNEQHLVQVWHAMGAFKKFGYARETAEPNSLTHKNYTEAICSSKELTKIYAESFGISEDKIIPVGVPRTDLFFDSAYKASATARLFEKEPKLKGKKVALFAPTFRGNSVNDGYYPSEYFNVGELMDALGDEWALIIKLHPFIKNKIEIPEKYSDRAFDFSDEREINDILLITDVLITDYSSVIFENAVIGGACVHYVPDIAEYENSRGFYFPYSDYLCGESVKNREELAPAVLRANADNEKMKKFKNRFVSLCDGEASKRFVQMILEER